MCSVHPQHNMPPCIPDAHTSQKIKHGDGMPSYQIGSFIPWILNTSPQISVHAVVHARDTIIKLLIEVVVFLWYKINNGMLFQQAVCYVGCVFLEMTTFRNAHIYVQIVQYSPSPNAHAWPKAE